MLLEDIRSLGVPPGAILLVHTALSKVGCSPRALIEALREALGPSGTLVMPSMADDDDVPFDRTRTPCRAVGLAADTFWRMPGVLRSDSPHAFAAIGPHAARITQPHPVDIPHGVDSPPGRVHELDGSVLLIGAGHDSNTTLHVAEHIAGVRYRQPKYATVLENGRPKRYEYGETDHCCENFALLDDWLGERQRRGKIGNADARLFRSRDAVAAALARLRENETVFLHPPSQCGECDLARAFSGRFAPPRPPAARAD